MNELVLVIDFMNYVHRCRVGPLTGEYVLIYNFFRNLRATVDFFHPSKLFFVTEGFPEHRYSLYPAYKGNRIKVASTQSHKDVIESANKIKELLGYLPCTIINHPKLEADDIVYSLCSAMKEENIIIVSTDSDYIQILQQDFKNCKIFNPIKKIFVENVAYPYIPWKCLNGDKSDNINKLLSPAKALKTVNDPELFKAFLSIEENRANFNINRQLIEFRLVPQEEIIVQESLIDFNKLKEEFARFKFETIINEKSWEKFTTTFENLI